jgi:nucleotide-binding universal stress UspA family protein
VFEKMLLAIDESEHSAKAVLIVKDLAARLDAEVIVLHVLERDASKVGAFDYEAPEEAPAIVIDAVQELQNNGVKARGEIAHTIYGRAAEQILDAAKKEGASLIVMGSRGLSDWAGLLLGSATQKVLHLGDIPVLVVR